MLIITEPRSVPARGLSDYIGWTLQGALSQGRTVWGRIIAVSIDEADGYARVTHEAYDPRSRRHVPAEAAITLDRVDFFQGSTEPHMLEITFAHTVPDTVPGDSDTARYNAVFDRVDARGLSIADAIASLTADALESAGLDY